jgi:hypothetical protein
MTKPYDVKATGLSVAECDKIALEQGGIVNSFGYGFAMPKGGDINEEYSSKVTNKQGMGNHGYIILVGKTPRAKKLLFEGKVKILTERGVSRRVAEKAVVSGHGMEKGVAELAEHLLPLVYRFDYRGGGYHAFVEWAEGVLPPEMVENGIGLSYPRIMSALEIAYKVVGKK